MIGYLKQAGMALALLAFSLTPVLGFAEAPALDYYYGIGCPHCANVQPVLEKFIRDNPGFTVNKYEVYQNQDNALELNKKFLEYGIPQKQRGVPILFYGNEFFVGDESIIENLAKFSEAKRDPPPESPVAEPENPARPLSLLAIAGAALVDSINPCAIAVLLILLGALMLSSPNKNLALWGGLVFTLAVYIGYFLFGLGLVSAFYFSGLASWVNKIVGALAIAIGLANLKDFFFYGAGGFVMEIPMSWRPRLKGFLNKITSPWGAFLAGFVVLFFELPCTGGPYFFVIGLLSQAESLTKIIPVLLFYNLVFVLPLLAIIGLIYWGKSSVEKASKWKDKNIRILHLIGGMIMLALGLWVIF